MKKWLVTGASGFLGTNAAIDLARDHQIFGMVRPGASLTLTDVTYIEADLLDPDSVSAAMEDIRPDVVLHAAAFSGHERCAGDPDLAFRVNAEGSQGVAMAARDVGSKLLYVSTDAVFDGQRGNYSEGDEPAPFSVYGRSKLEGERLVQEVMPDALILRTNFFGWSPQGSSSVLEFFVNALRRRATVPGYSDVIVSSLYVRQAVSAMRFLVDADVTGLVHVASTDALSKLEFGLAVAREFELDESLIEAATSNHDGRTTRWNRDISLDTSRLTTLLGNRLPCQVDGIKLAHGDELRMRAIFGATA